MDKNNQDAARNVGNERVQNQENPVNMGMVENVTNAAQEGVDAVGNVANMAREGVDAGANTAAPNTAAPVGLEAVLGMLAQVLARLPPAVTPAAAANNSPSVSTEPSVNATQESQTASSPSYLKVMDHMQRLGTKFFSGGAKPIEADEWRCRLERNFDSIRCPMEYRKDIAVHYLEEDAHTWWKGLSGRMADGDCTWDAFCREFQAKYFPPEAFDKLESAFLELRQGSKTVREYEAEFHSLKKYAGRELEAEEAQVRRFMRGLRIELRNGCLVRNYTSVAELVEKAALLENGLEEVANRNQERKVVATGMQARSGGGSGQGNKRWNKGAVGKGTRTPCATCGKPHAGVCRAASGECYRCGSLEHKARECPVRDTKGKGDGPDARKCFHCGESGHFKVNCPKMMQFGRKRANDELLPPPKRQAVMPRVYTMTSESSDPSTSQPITGKSYQLPK